MPRSEEQWEVVGYCIYCGSPVRKMDDEVKFTGPAECDCKLVIEDVTEKWEQRKNEIRNDLLA